MSPAFGHCLQFGYTVSAAGTPVDRMAAVEGLCSIGAFNRTFSNDVKGTIRSRSTGLRLLSRKKLRMLSSVHPQYWLFSGQNALNLIHSLGPSTSVQGGSGSCGCGGKSEFLGQGIGRGGPRSGRSILNDDFRTARGNGFGRAASVALLPTGKPLRSRRRSARPSRAGFVKDIEMKRKLRVAFDSFFASVGQTGKLGRFEVFNRSIMSAAAAAGLSFTLCSTAFASPVVPEQVQMPATPVTEDLRLFVESQLRRELQAQILVQEKWLEEIGQPLSKWTIDDRVRKVLEERAMPRLEENGRAVSKLEILESEVVPIFKAPHSKAKVASGGNSSQETAQEKVAVQPRKSPAVTMPPSPGKTPMDSAAEIVAVAAVPLGSVVSAASRTVGTAASVVALKPGAAVAGVNLFTRIMMHFGGGGIAGALGATMVYPLDTIKTRMQAQSSEGGKEAEYRNEWDCLQQLVAKEGPGSLYSGLIPQLMGIAPEKAMKLTVNEVLMEMLESQLPGVGPWALELIAGGGGGFSQVVFTNPMEIVKVRLQTQVKGSQPKSTWDVIKELGFQGLYTGSSVTLARDVPGSAIFFAIYTIIGQMYPGQSFLAGFIAAVPATFLTTPFDVIKTRLQMEKTDGDVEYKNGYDCFLVIMQKEGVGALFKGSLARVMKTSPQFGITLMLYSLLCP